MPTVPELVGAAVNIAITERLLDAQRDASRRLLPFAMRALDKAKEQFDAQMLLRDFDQGVYNDVLNLPEYTPNNDNVFRASRTGSFQAVNEIKANAFGISKYNCGNREDAILSALSGGIVVSSSLAADAGNFEDTLEAAYLQLKWSSISNSARFSPATSRAFGDTASSLTRQAELFGSAAESGVASVVNLATRAVLGNPDTASNNNTTGNVTVDVRPQASDTIA